MAQIVANVRNNWKFTFPLVKYSRVIGYVLPQSFGCLAFFPFSFFFFLFSCCGFHNGQQQLFACTMYIFDVFPRLPLLLLAWKIQIFPPVVNYTHTRHTRWCVLFFLFFSLHFFPILFFPSRNRTVEWNTMKIIGIFFERFVFVCLFQLTATIFVLMKASGHSAVRHLHEQFILSLAQKLTVTHR